MQSKILIDSLNQAEKREQSLCLQLNKAYKRIAELENELERTINDYEERLNE